MLYYNRYYNKCIIAIQDINNLDKLEQKINDSSMKQNLLKLRKNRVGESHYIINDNDDENMINMKRTVLLDKLKNAPEEVKVIINKIYPNLLVNIYKYIAPIIIEPDEDNLDIINDWWM